MDLTKMSIVELKAFAYDCIAQQEQAVNNLRAVNAEIQRKLQAVQQAVAAKSAIDEKLWMTQSGAGSESSEAKAG